MTDPSIDERPQRRREYSGPGSTLGVAALIVLAVGVAIWWFEFRDPGGSSQSESGYGVLELAASANPTGKAPAAEDGRAAPEFRLRDLAGGAKVLSQYRGNFVLLNFWATWCGPCRAEVPDLEAFQHQPGARGLVIVGVNQQESAADAAKFVKEFGVTYPVVLDSAGEVSVAYRVGRGLPISFLISPQGVILKVFLGRLTADDLAGLAKDFLS